MQRKTCMRRVLHLAVLLVLVTQAGAANAAAPSAAAEIVSLQGKGEFRIATEPRWRDAFIRQKLAEGNFVRTGDASRMGVLLADQTQVRLAANSMIQIKQVGDGRDRGTVLNQSAGRSWTQSRNVPNRLTVETPSALAAIRGTDWELVVDEDGSSTLTVLSGEVLLSNDQGSVSIGAGEQGRAQKGVAPGQEGAEQSARARAVGEQLHGRPAALSRDRESRGRPPGSQEAALQAIGALLRAGDLAAARRAVERLLAQRPATGTARLLSRRFPGAGRRDRIGDHKLARRRKAVPE